MYRVAFFHLQGDHSLYDQVANFVGIVDGCNGEQVQGVWVIWALDKFEVCRRGMGFDCVLEFLIRNPGK